MLPVRVKVSAGLAHIQPPVHINRHGSAKPALKRTQREHMRGASLPALVTNRKMWQFYCR